jgi:hypothetical protein
MKNVEVIPSTRRTGGGGLAGSPRPTSPSILILIGVFFACQVVTSKEEQRKSGVTRLCFGQFFNTT